MYRKYYLSNCSTNNNKQFSQKKTLLIDGLRIKDKFKLELKNMCYCSLNISVNEHF